MMNNADKSAFPADAERMRGVDLGLTKREYFAAKAMQGMCAGAHWAPGTLINEDEMAGDAVAIADATLAELAKPAP
jgi:hypothetical protein